MNSQLTVFCYLWIKPSEGSDEKNSLYSILEMTNNLLEFNPIHPMLLIQILVNIQGESITFSLGFSFCELLSRLLPNSVRILSGEGLSAELWRSWTLGHNISYYK